MQTPSDSSSSFVLVLEDWFGSPPPSGCKTFENVDDDEDEGCALRYQKNLERLVAFLHHLKAFLVLLQRKLMRHHSFGWNAAIRDG